MSSIATHTPGPWLEAGRGAGSHIHADKGEVAWLRSYMGIDDEQIEANARLIAAAPDLLAVAQKIVNNWGNLHHKDLMQLRAAIAKATGGQ